VSSSSRTVDNFQAGFVGLDVWGGFLSVHGGSPYGGV
jgi:hypothetical protein